MEYGNLNDLPDINSFRADLKKLDKFNFQGKSHEQIYNIYYDYARLLPTQFGRFSPEKFNQHKYYRVRLNVDRKKEDITLAQTYSYPPATFCYENGRANIVGKSVFYCSNDPNASILECKPKLGDEGFLSVWKGIAKRPIKIGNLLPSNLPPENVWNIMAGDAYKDFKSRIPKRAEDKSEHVLELYEFIAKKFTTEVKPYYLTSMLSWELLYGQLWRDLIIYPSVLWDSKLCNMAFHPNSVNENLRFEKLIKFKVVRMGPEGPEFQLGQKVGVINNTKMEWRKRSDEETNLFKKLK